LPQTRGQVFINIDSLRRGAVLYNDVFDDPAPAWYRLSNEELFRVRIKWRELLIT
jgi:hypothetical protein